MLLHRLLLLTCVLSFALITLGGVVHNTESSLACPDWPLCFGQVLPEMEGGVAIEHSHRLLASFVGLLTIAICVIAHRRRSEVSDVVVLSRWALGLVIGQGLLGGITVILKLPTLVSTAHLATSMAYFCMLVLMAYRTAPSVRSMTCNVDPRASAALRWVAIAGVAVYLQMILGALVRHTGSGAAVGLGPDSILKGFDLASGQRDFWPGDGPGRLHMAHRFVAPFVLATLLYCGHLAFWYARGRADRPGQALTLLAVGLCGVQIFLGAASIWHFLSIPLVTAHLSVGTALLISLIVLRMRLARVPATVAH